MKPPTLDGVDPKLSGNGLCYRYDFWWGVGRLSQNREGVYSFSIDVLHIFKGHVEANGAGPSPLEALSMCKLLLQEVLEKVQRL